MKYEIGKIQITLIFLGGVISGALLGFLPTVALLVAFLIVRMGSKSDDDAQDAHAAEAQPTAA